MKLGVYIRRLNQVRHVEGTIRAAVERGHVVTLYCDTRGPRTGPKGDEYPDPMRVPVRIWERAVVQPWPPDSATMPQTYLSRPPDWVDDALLVPAPLGIGLNVETPPERPLPPARVTCALQTAWSDLMQLTPHEACTWDAVYTWSGSWEQWWGDRWRPYLPGLFVPVGLPVAEHLQWIHRSEVRETFGVHGQAVLYLPFPFGAHEQSWRLRYGYRLSPWGERSTARAVRAYCDRQGRQLVVKSRAKTPVPGYLRELADIVVPADEPGEPTLLRLLTTAGLMVHHLSSGVAEAAAAGVRAVGIVPKGWTAYEGRGPDFDPDGTASFYGWSGLSVTWPQAWVRKRDLENAGDGVDVSARRAYVDRFLGPSTTGNRIVDDLEKRTEGR